MSQLQAKVNAKIGIGPFIRRFSLVAIFGSASRATWISASKGRCWSTYCTLTHCRKRVLSPSFRSTRFKSAHCVADVIFSYFSFTFLQNTTTMPEVGRDNFVGLYCVVRNAFGPNILSLFPLIRFRCLDLLLLLLLMLLSDGLSDHNHRSEIGRIQTGTAPKIDPSAVSRDTGKRNRKVTMALSTFFSRPDADEADDQ